MLAPVLAALAAIPAAAVINHLAVREPGYVITDPGDLPEGADPALLDELEPAPDDLPAVPVLSILRPRQWWRWWFPVVEVVLATVWAATVAELGWHAVTPALLVAEAVLLTLAVTDFRVYRIPDRLNFPGQGLTAALVAGAAVASGSIDVAIGAAAGAAIYSGMLFLAHLVSPRGMGFGDVKLAVLMGLALGSLSADSDQPLLLEALRWVLVGAAVGMVIGVVTGSVYALVRRSARAVFPYGPSLVAGCIGTLVWGSSLVG